MSNSPKNGRGRSLPDRLRSRLRMSRWTIRGAFAFHRFRKFLRILAVKAVRAPLVRLYFRHRDFAPAPAMITIRTTNLCNLRCKQCAQWGEHGVFLRDVRAEPARDLPTEGWKRFIRRMAWSCPHIYFFGGEPFLRKDLLELVRYAHDRGVVTGVNTNGHFLCGKCVDVVVSGMDYIIVSLDGPQEVNDRIRLGSPGGYAAVVAGVEELVRARVDLKSRFPLVEMILTITEENQGSIVATAELTRKLGVDYFAVQFGIFTTEELARQSSEQFRSEFGIEPKFYQGFVRDMSSIDPELINGQIQEVRRLWGSRYKQYPPVDFDVADYFRKPECSLVRKPCVSPWLEMQIMANGDMAFCADFADLTVGNVVEQDPLALWNGPVSRAWRRRIRTQGILPAETRCTSYYLS
jgi:MoaA/NifB/PqqE/SkfB family radical SAM enzyme